MFGKTHARIVSSLRSLGARKNNLMIRARNDNLRDGDRERFEKILSKQAEMRAKLEQFKKAQSRRGAR